MLVAGRTNDVFAATPAVVIDDLRLSITIRIKQCAHMSQRVPLRRVLRVDKYGVVAYHICPVLILLLQLEIVIGFSLTNSREQFRWMASFVEDVATGIIQRKAQTERASLFDLCYRCKDTIWC